MEKRILLIFIFVMFIGFSSSFDFIYDEIDDSSINTTLWQTATSASSAGVTATLTEGASAINAFTDHTASSVTGIATALLNSKELESNTRITNVTFRVQLDVQNPANANHNETAIISIFGANLRTLTCFHSSGCSRNDDSIYTILRNGTLGDNFWSAYNNSAFLKTFEATNNNLTMFSYLNRDATSQPDVAQSLIFYVYGQEDNLTTIIHSPGTTSLNQEVFFNFTTITETYRNLTNASLFIDGVLNETINLSGFNQTYNFSKTLDFQTDYIWSVEVCDTGNYTNCELSDNNSLSVNQWFEISTTFPSSATLGASVIISTLLNVSSGESVTLANLIFNNVSRSATITNLGGGQFNLSTSFDVNDSGNISFFVNFTLSTGESNQTNTYNMIVSEIGVDDCSVFTNTILNLTNVDEETQLILSNSTIEIALNMFSANGEVLVLNFSGNFTSNPLAVCINQSIDPSISYLLDAVIKYSGEENAIEYYNIVDFVVSNTSIPLEITLFDLNNSDSTEFQITFTDDDFLPAENVLIFVERQYITENTFKTVELPLTDSNGQTVVHLVRNDVVYNLRFVKDGVILRIFENVRAFCDDFSIGDCKISLSAVSTTQDIINYNEQLGIIFTSPPSYDNATNDISFSFISDDGSTKTVTLEVERSDIFGNRTICTNTLVSSSGVVSCDIGNANTTNTNLISKILVNGVVVSISNVPVSNFSYGDVGYMAWFLISLILVIVSRNSKNFMLISVIIGYAGGIGFGISNGGLIGLGSAGTWMIIISLAALWNLNKGRPQ